MRQKKVESQECNACKQNHWWEYAKTYKNTIIYSHSCSDQNININMAFTFLKLL